MSNTRSTTTQVRDDYLIRSSVPGEHYHYVGFMETFETESESFTGGIHIENFGHALGHAHNPSVAEKCANYRVQNFEMDPSVTVVCPCYHVLKSEHGTSTVPDEDFGRIQIYCNECN